MSRDNQQGESNEEKIFVGNLALLVTFSGSFAIRFSASDGQYTTGKEFTFIISDYFGDID